MNKELQEFELQEFDWWIEILTNNPNYLYYFGPFNNYWEAEWYKNGYIQDLEEEKAIIVNIEITQCQPKKLDMPTVPFGYDSSA